MTTANNSFDPADPYTWPYPQTRGMSIDELKTWSAGNDPINVAFTPLKERPGVGGTPGTPASPELPDSVRLMQVYNSSGTWAGEGQDQPDYLPGNDLWPQGVPNQPGLMPDNIYIQPWWQYIDIFVFGAFAPITLPSPWWANAAHANGVPVLGTVLLNPDVPTSVTLADINQLLTGTGPDGKSTGHVHGNEVPYYVAQLIKVAEYYGFDGWYFNVEQSLIDSSGDSLVDELLSFLNYFNDNMPDPLQIHWYDAVDADGELFYQNCLNDLNKAYFEPCNGFFANYQWFPTGPESIATSLTTATAIHRSPFDVYTGIQVYMDGEFTGQQGQLQTGETVRTCFANGISAGLYAATWSYQAAPPIPTPPPSPLKYPISYKVYDGYLAQDENLWIGAPSAPYTGSVAGGIGSAFSGQERTCPKGLPFVSHFNTGRGTQSAIQGSIVDTAPFGHVSQQELLPTWRFLLADGSSPADVYTIDFDYHTTPFTGGASLRLGANANSKGEVRLYKVDLPVTKNLWASYAIHQNGLAVGLKLTCSDGTIISLGDGHGGSQVPTSTVDYPKNHWQVRQYALAATYAGKTITEIGLLMATPTCGTANIGMIQLTDTAAAPVAPSSVTDLTSKTDGVDLPGAHKAVRAKLQWSGSASDEVAWYEVYQIDGQDSTWLGRAYALGYWAIIPLAKLAPATKTIKLAVLAVSTRGARQTLAEATTVEVAVPATT